MSDYLNVLEAAEVHDTIVICNQAGLFGSEKRADGWYTTFQDFGRWTEHQFFKDRNEASVGLAYNNMQSADRIDYAFHAMSMGVRFFGPITNLERASGADGAYTNEYMSHWFQYDLPNHCSFTLKVGQDEQIDLSGFMAPPGYGPSGGASAFGLDASTTIAGTTPPIPYSRPQSVFVGTQGVPDKRNRYSLVTRVPDPETGEMLSKPLEIPRNETIEVRMRLSEYAQNVLKDTVGPMYYVNSIWNTSDGETYEETPTIFPVRYGIQVSLYGVREVQQRGEYHAI